MDNKLEILCELRNVIDEVNKIEKQYDRLSSNMIKVCYESNILKHLFDIRMSKVKPILSQVEILMNNEQLNVSNPCVSEPKNILDLSQEFDGDDDHDNDDHDNDGNDHLGRNKLLGGDYSR
jgi:hypothetical protein